LRQYGEARDAYERGLALEPGNAQLQSGLADVEAAAGKGGDEGGLGGLFSSPEALAKLAANPTTRAYLQQPDFVAMFQAVQKDPAAANRHLSDPRMMQTLSVLLGINMMSGDAFAKQQASQSQAPPPPPPPPVEVEMTDAEKEEAAEAAKAKAAKAAAVAEKEAGNAAYKRRDFAEALARYDAAIALDPSDISFLTNRAAVHLEQGDFAACVADCDAAVEAGQAARADFKAIARALARKGSALQKSGDLAGAVAAFGKSLMEHRTAETLGKLQAAEKALKAAAQAAYEDEGLGDAAREAGNAAFKEGRFPEAVKQYSEAIARNPRDHRAFSNRSACYTKLAAWAEGLKDAERCVELAPGFAKGYSRKGAVQFFMKDYDKALATYQAGLAQEPDSEELRDGVARCSEQIGRAARGQLSEEELKERQARAMADPEIQMILTDPVMRQVLSDFQSDPKAAQHHTQNPGIMAKLQKLVNAGILRLG